MGDHPHSAVERHCDVCVVGGSAAGLAAALQLGRQRRSVIVVDAGEPRNRSAAHLHGYLGRDGESPAALVAAGRDEVRRYGTEVLDGRVRAVRTGDGAGFRVELSGGHVITARRVVVATGLVDELPEIAGIAEHWGRAVIHCPFCHGYEVRDRRIVQVITHPSGLRATALFRQLSAALTVVWQAEDALDDATRARLDASGVAVRVGKVQRLVTGSDGRARALELADGTSIAADAVALSPRCAPRLEPFATLGLAPTPHASGLGTVLASDANGVTAVPGVYAAGSASDPSQQVLSAAAAGSRVGAMVAFDLAEEDLGLRTRPSANAADWDHRYAGEQMWSGNPNGTLVHEVAALTPGRALDVGAGEGGDALWLAAQGWSVSASDVSQRALERIATAADQRGVAVALLQADANAPDAFAPGGFDLVSAQYAAIPRTPDARAVRNLMAAVAPGGTLLVVSHALDAMRAPVDTALDSRPFDPDAYVRVEDVAAAVAAAPDWETVIHESRPRPPGAASTHHVDDIVLRARRLPR